MNVCNNLVIVYGVRCLVLLLFLWSASWKTILYFCTLAVTIYAIPKQEPSYKKKTRKTKDILAELYPKLPCEEQNQIVVESIISFVTYNVENTLSLQNFEVIKANSECVFARQAKVWGSPEWIESLYLEGNITRLLPMFLKFTLVCSQHKLDAFLIELPGVKYGQSLEEFGRALQKVLTIISDRDPKGVYCMNKSYIGKRGWVFEFNHVTFFITTFAPFYPVTHARYSHGAENCYILFQPELSFAYHDLPEDTPNTNWTDPKTVRDKIRVAFRNAGRGYSVPENVSSPMALEIIRPIHEDDPVFEWWNLSST